MSPNSECVVRMEGGWRESLEDEVGEDAEEHDGEDS